MGVEVRVEVDAPVSLLFDGGSPSRLEWEGVAWWVIDRPTRLTREVDWLHPIITHPPEGTVRHSGWRFIAKPSNGQDAQMFDVFESVLGWQVCCVWN